MTQVLTEGKRSVEMNDTIEGDESNEFIQDVLASFPIDNEETLIKFNGILSNPTNVSQFVKYMSGMYIKDSKIKEGNKLVRRFVDNFFSRSFMLTINRTGTRRSIGPPKVKLEQYQHILSAFHKCIKVGAPNFGLEGTKTQLWRLCDTAKQRYTEAEQHTLELEIEGAEVEREGEEEADNYDHMDDDLNARVFQTYTTIIENDEAL